MFLYLEANKFRKTWTIELEELKTLLNCQNEESYKKFKVFNDRILKLIKKEMDEKTDCRYKYETVKKGKNVVAIKFTYLSGSSFYIYTESNNQDIDTDKNTDTDIENQELWKSALERYNYNFTPEQLQELKEVLVSIPDKNLPLDTTTGTDSIDFRWYHYLAQKLATMERQNSQKKIANKFLYLLKTLKRDALL